MWWLSRNACQVLRLWGGQSDMLSVLKLSEVHRHHRRPQIGRHRWVLNYLPQRYRTHKRCRGLRRGGRLWTRTVGSSNRRFTETSTRFWQSVWHFASEATSLGHRLSQCALILLESGWQPRVHLRQWSSSGRHGWDEISGWLRQI